MCHFFNVTLNFVKFIANDGHCDPILNQAYCFVIVVSVHHSFYREL